MSSTAGSDRPPPPNREILSLVSALSSPENHDLHVQAIQARDQALSASSETFGNLCLQLAFLLLITDHSPPEQIWSLLHPEDLQGWQQTDPISVQKLQQQPAQWLPFGQMAGLILKNALTRPPILQNSHVQAAIPSGPVAQQLQECIFRAALECQHAEIRSVASSILSTCVVSTDGVQPALHVQSWPQFIPRLLAPLSQPAAAPHATAGALETLRKILEDAPGELDENDLDHVVNVLMQLLSQQQHTPETQLVQILQALSNCLLEGDFPSALVLHMETYIQSLLQATQSGSRFVRPWACRGIATLLELRADCLMSKFAVVAQTMLERTTDEPLVALELAGDCD